MICADERLTPISGPKSIVQLPRRLARLGEVLDRDDAADAHVDRGEVVEGRLGERRVGHCAHGPDVEHAPRGRARRNLEGDHRLRPRDAGELRELPGDHLGELLVARHRTIADEVPLAGDRVGLGDARRRRRAAAELASAVALGLDQDDRRGSSSS